MNQKTKNMFTRLFALSLMVTMVSCATVFGGRKNTIKVEVGTPIQAQVFLDGQYLGETPYKARISKYKIQEGSIIEIKKEGYETFTYQVERNPHLLYVAANVVSGALPLIIDVADGNIYRPNTRNIEYHLVPINDQALQSEMSNESIEN